MATRNVSIIMSLQDKASAAIKSINENMDSMVKKADGAGKKMESMSKSMGKVGKKMTTGVTLPLVGVGTAAVKTVSNFDDAMANVQKISGATGEEFDDLRAKAMELGSTTAFSASEAADGMGVLAASGMEANDVMAVSEDMFNLMSAGSVSAETAASVLTNTMAQFNMTAEESGKIVDTFAATSAKSKISVDQLEHGMSIAGSTMAGMNMDIVESTAAFGHLANAGMPVEQLGTAINAMGREIKANAGDFKTLGVEVYDSEGKLKDMGSVMKDLEVATAGMNDEQRDAALSTVFSGQAMQGATNWLNQGADAYSKLTDEIIRETNAAETMAAIQEDTIGGAFRAVKSATEGLMIEIGDILKKPLQDIAKWVAELAGKFGKLDTPTKEMIVKIGLVAAAIGPVLLVGNKLLSGGSKAIGVFGKVAGAISGISLPMIAGVAAAALLGGAIYRLWTTNEEFRDTVIEVWETIKTKLGEALEAIKLFWDEHGEEIKTKVTEIFDRIGEIISGAFEVIVEVVSLALGWISEFWNDHGETIMSAASLAWDTISGVIDGAMQVIQGVIEVVLGVIEGDWDAVWNGIQTIFEGVMTAVEAAWNAAKEVVGVVIEGVVNALTDAFHTAVDAAKTAWEDLKTILKNPITGTISVVQRRREERAAKKADGSHATGAYNIPFDGYIGELHRGEMVLTKQASDEYRAMGGTEKSVPRSGGRGGDFAPTLNITVNNPQDTKETVAVMKREWERLMAQYQKKKQFKVW